MLEMKRTFEYYNQSNDVLVLWHRDISRSSWEKTLQLKRWGKSFEVADDANHQFEGSEKEKKCNKKAIKIIPNSSQTFNFWLILSSNIPSAAIRLLGGVRRCTYIFPFINLVIEIESSAIKHRDVSHSCPFLRPFEQLT